MPKIAKVPVVMQMEALECGAASLAMMLAFMANGFRWNEYGATAEYPATAAMP